MLAKPFKDELPCHANSPVIRLQVLYVNADVPTAEVLRGFLIPKVPTGTVSQAVALIGSLVMPHNIYLHSALVQTRRLHRDTEAHRREALMYYSLESGISLLVSRLGYIAVPIKALRGTAYGSFCMS